MMRSAKNIVPTKPASTIKEQGHKDSVISEETQPPKDQRIGWINRKKHGLLMEL